MSNNLEFVISGEKCVPYDRFMNCCWYLNICWSNSAVCYRDTKTILTGFTHSREEYSIWV